MEYEIVAEAYRDLEQASGRLMLIDRLATLLAETPQELLPTVCYLCQGLVAPEFAGIDLGLAEKMALRAVATATSVEPEEVVAAVRETGDLGQAAERLLAATAGDRKPSLQVAAVVDTLHEIARTEGSGSQGRKLELLAGLLTRATPLEARYLLRLVTGNLRLGIGTPTILDALAQVYAGSRKDRPVLERAYNICCDLGLVAATLVAGGLTAVKELRVRAGNPVRVMLAQRLSEADEILARLGGQCMAEYKYDGMRLQAHRTADGQIELFTRRQERVSTQFPDVVELLQTGLGPREAILEGEVVAYDAAAGELRPFQEVMFRRRKHGIAEAARDVPVGLFCFELLYADGEDLTRAALSGSSGAARRGAHIVGPAPADHGAMRWRPRRRWMRRSSKQLRTAQRVWCVSRPARTRSIRQAPAAGCGSSSSGITAPSWPTPSILSLSARYAGRGRRRGTYGAVLLAAYNPEEELYQTVGRCGTGFSDAELAALPAKLAPLTRKERPARVDSRVPADVWFEPSLVLEILSAELTLSPNHTAGWGQLKDDAGLSMRFPRFTGRWRDDKEPQDATTTQQLVELYRTARRAPAT